MRRSCSRSGLTLRAKRLIVEHLEQRGERLQVAVVRGRREEQPVFEVRGRVSRIAWVRSESIAYLPRACGAHVVHLVDDEQVEGARVVGPLRGGPRGAAASGGRA